MSLSYQSGVFLSTEIALLPINRTGAHGLPVNFINRLWLRKKKKNNSDTIFQKPHNAMQKTKHILLYLR
jgi:hypothetical protein